MQSCAGLYLCKLQEITYWPMKGSGSLRIRFIEINLGEGELDQMDDVNH